MPTAPYTLEAPKAFHGRTVVGVAGRAWASAVNGTGLLATIYVPTEPPYTPVGATLTFGTGAAAGVEAVVFNHWGQRTNPPLPATVVAFSSRPTDRASSSRSSHEHPRLVSGASRPGPVASGNEKGTRPFPTGAPSTASDAVQMLVRDD